MNDELIKALKEELEAFKKNMPQYASVEDVSKMAEVLEAKLEDSKLTKELDELKKTITKHSETIIKLNDERVHEKGKTVASICKAAASQFQDVVDGKISKFTLKVSKADVLRTGVTDHTLAMRLPDVGQKPAGNTVIAPLFRQGRVGPNSNGMIRYVDQLAITRGAGMVAEGTQKPESAITWQEYTLNLEKIADTIPVSKEALADVDFISGEIQRLLEVNIALQEDGQVWEGTGTTPAMKGVYVSAAAFTPAATVKKANIYDLIVKMQEQVMANTGYNPNYVIMNIAAINDMRLEKDDNGNYIMPPFATASGQQVAGMTIVQSSSVADTTMLVGDFNYGTYYTLEDINIQVGHVGNQFAENMVTILAEKRGALLVRTVDAGAFVKVTDITAAVTAITKV